MPLNPPISNFPANGQIRFEYDYSDESGRQSRSIVDLLEYTISRAEGGEVRPRKDHRGVNLISDALPFGRLWYGEPDATANAISYAKSRSRSHDAVIRVYDEVGYVIETHEHTGDFKEP